MDLQRFFAFHFMEFLRENVATSHHFFEKRLKGPSLLSELVEKIHYRLLTEI